MRYIIAFLFCFAMFAVPPVVGDWKKMGYYDTVVISCGYPENNNTVVWVKLYYVTQNAIQIRKYIYKDEGKYYTGVEQNPGAPMWYGWVYLQGGEDFQ